MRVPKCSEYEKFPYGKPVDNPIVSIVNPKIPNTANIVIASFHPSHRLVAQNAGKVISRRFKTDMYADHGGNGTFTRK
jgi:hypothetical protein